MRTTKKMLDTKFDILNRMLNLNDGSKYYVGYENGMANIFKEDGGGRITIQYGMTAGEIAKCIDVAINILERSRL